MAVVTLAKEFDRIDQVDMHQLTNEYDVNQLLDYVHEGLGELGQGYALDLYYRYLRQRWDVMEIDFTQDLIDWDTKLTQEQRDVFLRVATGFHHGEREVAMNLVPLILAAPREEQKMYLASQIEDEVRHTVFFDRFYNEVVQLGGTGVQDTLDKSWGYVQDQFGGAFGTLSIMADQLRLRPDDRRLLVEFLTFYQLFIEGVGALSTMKITLTFCKKTGYLPGYHEGFLATARDEARHVVFGTHMLREILNEDPTLVRHVHEMLYTTFSSGGFGGAADGSLGFYRDFEAIGFTYEQYQEVFTEQVVRTLKQAGVKMTDEIQMLLDNYKPIAIGG